MTVEGIELSYWVVAAVLAGFPGAYLLNSWAPWGRRMLFDGDRSPYLRYWAAVAVLHWTSVAVVWVLLETTGHGLADVGLTLPDRPIVLGLSVTIVLGAAGIYVVYVLGREPIPNETVAMPYPGALVPMTPLERCVQLLIGGVTAGVCEEVVYRGFAIVALLGAGFPWWAAIAISSIAFVLVHGIPPLRWPALSVPLFAFGVAMSAAFLLSGTLLVPIALHFGYNLVTYSHMTSELLGRSRGVTPVR